nr:hypothetical protein CFP56_39483 [Quercus suber]
MDQAVVDGLLNLHLTKEEEVEIPITARCRSDLLEECNLSLFGRLLSDRNQNLRALKSTLRSAWKMGSDLQIVEVGSNVLQFKFGSEYQLQWVEKNGPWNFENNLLLLCRWRRGLSSKNITFTHSPFWIQIWGLPFELMAEEVCRDLGNSLGSFIETDRRTGQSDQAKFMRVRVDLQLDKPLRRGAKIASVEGEKYWVSFRAQGSFKTGIDRSRSTSSGRNDRSNEDKFEEHTPTMAKNSFASVMDGGGSTSGTGDSQNGENQIMGKKDNITGVGDDQSKKTLNGWDNTARIEQVPMYESVAREDAGTPPIVIPRSFKIEKVVKDALSLAGQSAQTEKDQMEVTSPLKTSTDANTAKEDTTGPIAEKKIKAKVHIKKLAREHSKNKSPQPDAVLLPVGTKRGGKLIFEDDEEVFTQKKQRTAVNINQTESEVRSAVAARQHRREP